MSSSKKSPIFAVGSLNIPLRLRMTRQQVVTTIRLYLEYVLYHTSNAKRMSPREALFFPNVKARDTFYRVEEKYGLVDLTKSLPSALLHNAFKALLDLMQCELESAESGMSPDWVGAVLATNSEEQYDTPENYPGPTSVSWTEVIQLLLPNMDQLLSGEKNVDPDDDPAFAEAKEIELAKKLLTAHGYTVTEEGEDAEEEDHQEGSALGQVRSSLSNPKKPPEMKMFMEVAKVKGGKTGFTNRVYFVVPRNLLSEAETSDMDEDEYLVWPARLSGQNIRHPLHYRQLPVVDLPSHPKLWEPAPKGSLLAPASIYMNRLYKEVTFDELKKIAGV